jgi:hypothetical protein
VLADLLEAGAIEMPFTAFLRRRSPTSRCAGRRGSRCARCRRTTFEWVLRREVLAQPGVELRDGIAVEHLDAVPGDRRVVVVAEATLTWSSTHGGRDRRPTPGWRDRCHARRRRAVRERHRTLRFYRLIGAAADRPAPNTAAVDLGYLWYKVFVGDRDTFSITYAVDARRRVAPHTSTGRARGGDPAARGGRTGGHRACRNR